MTDPARFLLDAAHSGAHSGLYAAPASVAVLRQGARASGLAWFELDLAGVAGKAAFFARCQIVFGLPPSFGHNWDALADCLEDLAWQPARGYGVFISNGRVFARQSPADLDAALEIFAAAATYWMVKGRLFMALLDVETRGSRALKSFPV